MTGIENERLTRVGPGTAGGKLLRKYWHPVAVSAQVATQSVRSVRLLGEDLVIYRGRSGLIGVVAQRCPHRGASLSLGSIEGDSLRCLYHGWKFDANVGQWHIQELPGSPRATCNMSLPPASRWIAKEVGGLVFLHHGTPLCAPPNFEIFSARDRVQIRHATVRANWLQIMENGLDPLHLEWLHGHFTNELRAARGDSVRPLKVRRHTRIVFEPWDLGIRKRRLLDGQSEECEDWQVGQVVIFPTMLCLVGPLGQMIQFRVPIDDSLTWHLWYEMKERATSNDAPRVLELAAPLTKNLADDIDRQDIMIWESQGAIADRTQETLTSYDAGVLLFRQMLSDQIDCVEAGLEPLAASLGAGGAICFPTRQDTLPVVEPLRDL